MSLSSMTFRVAVLFCFGIGCDSGPRSSAGFRLPLPADAGKGQIAFVAHECHTCHTIRGVPLPEPAIPDAVVLGGQTVRQMTDGHLVTSIINPSHAVAARAKYPSGRSPMPDYTDSMTVRELTDIVSFLQSRYVVERTAVNPVPF